MKFTQFSYICCNVIYQCTVYTLYTYMYSVHTGAGAPHACTGNYSRISTNLFPSQHTCKWSLILQVFCHQLRELATGQMVQFHLENCIHCVFTRTIIKNIQFSNFLSLQILYIVVNKRTRESCPVSIPKVNFFINYSMYN